MAQDEHKEGIGGMANPGRYGIERLAYWLMRLSGLGLLAYFIGHIYETSNILRGRVGWDEVLAMTQTTEGHIVLAIVIGMCVFHTVNGIRVMLGHGGIGSGQAKPPGLSVHAGIAELQAQDRDILCHSTCSSGHDVRAGSPVW